MSEERDSGMHEQSEVHTEMFVASCTETTQHTDFRKETQVGRQPGRQAEHRNQEHFAKKIVDGTDPQ